MHSQLKQSQRVCLLMSNQSVTISIHFLGTWQYNHHQYVREKEENEERKGYKYGPLPGVGNFGIEQKNGVLGSEVPCIPWKTFLFLLEVEEFITPHEHEQEYGEEWCCVFESLF